jgi:adenylosuccinate synthase
MNTVVTGLQWGDEGKGKIVDFLTETADLVVRGQGGNNAGHTVIVGDNKYILHLIPSGILWGGKTCVIGNGVVLDPIGLVQEIRKIEGQGIVVSPDGLRISDRAHVVMPYHKELDAAREAALGNNKIGTTKRGIGPTYADKANRCGLRLADLINPHVAPRLIESRLEEVNAILASHDLPTFTLEGILESLAPALERLAPHITNTIPLLHDAWKTGRQILFEGAQGFYLDVDYGTYPFVTSSNTSAGGASTGSGLPPHAIQRVVGVCKAYTTRVGSGPFITENQDIADYLHGLGREFGATTGRARRCGWLDTVLLRFACMVNGVTDLAVTNLDGLDERDSIDVCVAYAIDGEQHALPPADRDAWDRATPVYETLPGWQQDTSACRTWDDLPENARAYLDRLAELSGAPVKYVGIGPDREQTILL